MTAYLTPAQRERKNAQLRARRAELRALRPSPTPLDRLLARVEKQADGCWLWTGPVYSGGYARASAKGEKKPAHRLAYESLVGPLPAGRPILDHTCHTAAVVAGTCEGGECPHRRCVNPDHLEPVTAEENARRSVRARPTKCPQGHPYDEANTYVNSKGRKICRTCKRARELAATERLRMFREPKP